MKILIVLLGSATIIGVIGLLGLKFLPKTNCCAKVDKIYVKYDDLRSRAAHGDRVAMWKLYQDAKAAGDETSARREALVGALAGSPELIQEYGKIYQTLSSNLRISDEAIMRKNTDKPGASGLADLLGIDLTP